MVGKRQGVATRFVIKLSLLATLLSVMVMILTEAILVGFKQSIEHKVYAFWGHVSAEALQDRENYFMHQNYRADLIKMKEFLINSPEVKSFRAYGSKYGVLLSENSLDGVVFKGYQYSPKQEGFSGKCPAKKPSLKVIFFTPIICLSFISKTLSTNKNGYLCGNLHMISLASKIGSLLGS